MIRKIRNILAIFLSLSVLLTGNFFVMATEPEYTVITTVEQLNAIRENVDSEGRVYGKYKLGADVVFEDGETFLPIGINSTATENKAFIGEFDGNGYTIKNIKYKVETTNASVIYLGLFGYNNGTIKNLNLENVSLDITETEHLRAGSIAAIMSNIGGRGKIENCYVKGEFKIQNPPITGYARIGGIVGQFASGSIKNTVCDINIDYQSANSENIIVGGIAGETNGNIIDCGNRENISVTSNSGLFAGGIAGIAVNTNSTIENCYNLGDIKGESEMDLCLGGILGGINDLEDTKVNISYTYTTGLITPTTHVQEGGFTSSIVTVASGAVAGSFGGESFDNYYLKNIYSKPSGIGSITSADLNIAQMSEKETSWYLPQNVTPYTSWKNINNLKLYFDREIDKQYLAIDIAKPIKIDAYYKDGSNTVTEDAVFSESPKLGNNSFNVNYGECEKEINYLGYIKGDVDFNGNVNVTDLVATATAIVDETDLLEKTVAAEIDNNGFLSVTDLVGIRNIILNT